MKKRIRKPRQMLIAAVLVVFILSKMIQEVDECMQKADIYTSDT